MPQQSHFSTTKFLLALLPLLNQAACQKNPKRGLAFAHNPHSSDTSLISSPNSTLTWYYNWSPYPNSDRFNSDTLEFIPLIHGLDGASDPRTSRVISRLPSSSEHLLSFNEPDGSNESGGSSISPEDAAQAYIEHIVPYRNSERAWKISHPSTTGSGMGLEWLRAFNASCYDIDPENGCPTDFIAAHFYGGFEGLASWLGTLEEFYNKDRSEEQKLKIWVTEMALPQAGVEETVAMLNQSLAYLDELEYVERYAWFGSFRTDDANEWTGDAVAMFDDDGGLTEVGAVYMGGESSGFAVGQKGQGSGVGLVEPMRWLMVLAVSAVLLSVW
ncbi:glycoside hydrolase family 128 protein [Sporormia fimetaria CBS 119925]|uniref:Glycoside hydrolase family 128 protein n=1 Tax=Sporormia fimetaria CBS 119925 TaxID=1340428 RepID=A0A6A6V2Y5_9PLEO|nr:glycoside hydrolase family 128 protein [Sporormia fimetaria CBS 119925]